MILDYLLFFLFALACEVLGTIGGFGSSVIFVPLAAFFLPRPMVLGLTSILHVFSNVMKVVLFRKTIDMRLFWLFGIPGLLFTVAGAFLAGSVDTRIAEWVLGIFLLGFSVLMIAFPKMSFKPSNANALWSGSLAGFSAGFIGTGGAIRGMALVSFNLEKNVFVGTSASIDFGVDLSRFFIYSWEGFMEGLDWMYVFLLLIASGLGTYLGKLWLNKIGQDTFRKIVLFIILATALATIYRAV